MTKKLLKKAKGTMALGVTTMVGSSVMGSMVNKDNVGSYNSANAGLGLLNTANMAKIGTDMFGKSKRIDPARRMLGCKR